jgi:hypothetical protein
LWGGVVGTLCWRGRSMWWRLRGQKSGAWLDLGTHLRCEYQCYPVSE